MWTQQSHTQAPRLTPHLCVLSLRLLDRKVDILTSTFQQYLQVGSQKIAPAEGGAGYHSERPVCCKHRPGDNSELPRQRPSPPPTARRQSGERLFSRTSTLRWIPCKPHIDRARDVVQPHIDMAKDASAPYVQKAQDTIEPRVRAAANVAEPYAHSASDKLQPYVESAQQSAQPAIDKTKEVLGTTEEQKNARVLPASEG